MGIAKNLETTVQPQKRPVNHEFRKRSAVKLFRETQDRWVLRIVLFAGLVSLARLTAAPATNRSPVAVWDVSARAEVGGGYKYNVLLTSVAPESSAFVSVAADASFIR